MVQVLGSEMGVETAAKKEIERMGKVIGKVNLLKDTKDARQVLLLSESYFSDAKHFFSNKRFVEAFEAAIISWCYIDAGINLGVFSVPSENQGIFTFEFKK